MESRTSRPRIAVIGAGLIGARHVELVSQSSDAELAAVVEPDERVAASARAAGIPWYRSPGELLATDPPDAAIIATPSDLHVEHALACVRANVAVLVEKPIATSVRDGKRRRQAASRCWSVTTDATARSCSRRVRQSGAACSVTWWR